jgi:hypothetical protein
MHLHVSYRKIELFWRAQERVKELKGDTVDRVEVATKTI